MKFCMLILLMEEMLHQLIWRIYHYLQGFMYTGFLQQYHSIYLGKLVYVPKPESRGFGEIPLPKHDLGSGRRSNLPRDLYIRIYILHLQHILDVWILCTN